MSLYQVQLDSYLVAGAALRSAWPPEQALGETALDSFLDEMHYCVLATVTGRGRPQARPVAFMVFGGSLWFGTGPGGRLRNVHKTPWISAVVSDRDGDGHRAVVADGLAIVLEAPPGGLLELWERRFESRPDWATHWLELRPKRLFSYAAPASGA